MDWILLKISTEVPLSWENAHETDRRQLTVARVIHTVHNEIVEVRKREDKRGN